MKHVWIRRGFKIALMATIVIAGFGQAVHQLWNLLMPEIFGVQAISFWQSVGLLALSWMLFGGFARFGGRPRFGAHWRERMAQMSPEEQERFRAGMVRRCGPKLRPSEG